MNNQEERQAISQACDHLKQVLLAKNHDYGNSFGETFAELGPISGFTRFLDKANRLKQLLTDSKQDVADESIADTWLDAAGYAILNYIETTKAQTKTQIVPSKIVPSKMSFASALKTSNKEIDKNEIAIIRDPRSFQEIHISQIEAMKAIDLKTMKKIAQIFESPFIRIVNNKILVEKLIEQYKRLQGNNLYKKQQKEVEKAIDAFESQKITWSPIDNDTFESQKITWDSNVAKYGLVILPDQATKDNQEKYTFYSLDFNNIGVIKQQLFTMPEAVNRKFHYPSTRKNLFDDLDKQQQALIAVFNPKILQPIHFTFSGEIAPEIDESTVYFEKL